MVRGTSEAEVLLKNARTEFKEEAEEIANYTAIQRLAESVGDKDTAQLAKAILREEKRMAGFLEKLIPRLTTSVVQAEIPRRERNGGRKRTTSRSTTSRSTTSRRKTTTSRSRGTGTKSTAKRTTRTRSGAAKKTRARSR
jgi:rubrerythrin